MRFMEFAAVVVFLGHVVVKISSHHLPTSPIFEDMVADERDWHGKGRFVARRRVVARKDCRTALIPQFDSISHSMALSVVPLGVTSTNRAPGGLEKMRYWVQSAYGAALRSMIVTARASAARVQAHVGMGWTHFMGRILPRRQAGFSVQAGVGALLCIAK